MAVKNNAQSLSASGAWRGKTIKTSNASRKVRGTLERDLVTKHTTPPAASHPPAYFEAAGRQRCEGEVNGLHHRKIHLEVGKDDAHLTKKEGKKLDRPS